MRRRQLLLGAAVVAGLISCSVPPDSYERLAQSIVLTKRAPKADFGAYKTFYLRPEIRMLSDDADGGVESVAQIYATQLLTETRQNLVARGYQEVDKASAELAVEMVYLRSVSTAVTCYSWYDPYYWGYPAWGYYPYYGGCATSTWRSGTLATMIVDLTPAITDPGGGVGIGQGGEGGGGPGQALLSTIWFSGVYGIEYDYTDDTVARARQGIDQAFAQSPYLATSR